VISGQMRGHGRFLLLALQVVNIVQVIVNNVRALSGASRYTLVTYKDERRME